MSDKRRSGRLRDTAPKSLREESSSDEEESDEQQDSDNEERQQPASKKRKSPGQKKQPQQQAAKPASPAPSKRQRNAANEAVHGLSLFEIITKHPAAVSKAAKEWVTEYQDDKPKATAKLFTMVIQASGSDETVTEEDVEEGDVDELVKRLADAIIKDGGAEPFKDRRHRHLTTVYSEFWNALVSELHQVELLVDDYVMDKVCNLVIALSCSTVRPFRLAATLTASQLVSSWINIQQQLVQAVAQAQFQMEAESKKKGANKSLVSDLKKQLERYHRRMNTLKQLTSNIISAVFTVRFRDVSEQIRAIVISSIGSWIATMPETFLGDAHLKYIGWALSDKDESVRLAAVSGLLDLYKRPENISDLRDFKGRFLERFRELIYDVSEDVAVKGLELLTQLVVLGELDKDSVKEVHLLLADESAKIRHAASQLVARLLMDAAAQHAKDAGGSKAAATPVGRGGKKGAKTPTTTAEANGAVADQTQALASQLSALLESMTWLQQGSTGAPAGSKGHTGTQGSQGRACAISPLRSDVVDQLVDALYHRLPVLKKWGMIVDALVDDAKVEARSHTDNVHLVLVLCAVAHKAKEEEGGGAKHAARPRGGRNKAKAADGDALQELTTAVMQQLPAIVRKYQTEPVVVASLAALVRSLKIELYSLKGEERSFQELLALLSDQLFRHAHEAVARQVVDTLVACASQSFRGLQSAAQLVLSDTVNKAASQLVSVAKAVQMLSKEDLAAEVEELVAGDAAGAAELYALRAALTRVMALLTRGAHTMASQTPAYNALSFLLDDVHNSGRLIGTDVTRMAISCVHAILLWGIHKVQSDAGRSAAVDAAVAELVQKRDTFLEQLSGIYDVAEGDEKLRDVIFRAMSDVVLMFGGETWKGTAVEGASLVDPPDNVLRKIWMQCLSSLTRNDPGDAAEEQEEQTQDEEASAAAVARNAKVKAQLEAVAVVGRLLVTNSLGRHFKWLGINLVSNFVSFGPEVADMVKEICRTAKQVRPAAMPDTYLGAMKVAYAPVLNEDVDTDDALQDFSALSKKIASLYAGHNINREEIIKIVRGGIHYGLQQPPAYFNFLAWGLALFTNKLPASDTDQLASEVEAALQKLKYDPEDDAWQPATFYLQGLKERATRGKGVGKGALKGPSSAKNKRSRKISFAPGAAGAGKHARQGSDHEDHVEEHGHSPHDLQEGHAAHEEEQDSEEQGWLRKARTGHAQRSMPTRRRRTAMAATPTPIPLAAADLDLDLDLPEAPLQDPRLLAGSDVSRSLHASPPSGATSSGLLKMPTEEELPVALMPDTAATAAGAAARGKAFGQKGPAAARAATSSISEGSGGTAQAAGTHMHGRGRRSSLAAATESGTSAPLAACASADSDARQEAAADDEELIASQQDDEAGEEGVLDLYHRAEESEGGPASSRAHNKRSASAMMVDDATTTMPATVEVQEPSQLTTGGVEPPPRPKRRRRL